MDEKDNNGWDSSSYQQCNTEQRDTYNLDKIMGLLFGIFAGLLGLFGLMICDTEKQRRHFMKGWWCGFIISTVLTIVIIIGYIVMMTVFYEGFLESLFDHIFTWRSYRKY